MNNLCLSIPQIGCNWDVQFSRGGLVGLFDSADGGTENVVRTASGPDASPQGRGRLGHFGELYVLRRPSTRPCTKVQYCTLNLYHSLSMYQLVLLFDSSLLGSWERFGIGFFGETIRRLHRELHISYL